MNPPALSFYLQLPVLILIISLVYSATRYDDWGPIVYEAFRWSRNMVGFLLAIGVVLYVLAMFI